MRGDEDELRSAARRRIAASGLAGAAALAGVGAAAGVRAALATPAPTSETVARAARRKSPVTEIDVQDFGAVGDGVTDDAPAINAAIRAMREHHARAGRFDLLGRLVFPAGVYRVNSSLNFTTLRGINTVVAGDASVILGCCAGQPVIDALGARWLTVRDLTVIGDETAVPSIGVQIGILSAQTVADDHRFENVKVLGHYSIACLYNRAAETTGFDHVFLWNDQPDSYCLIQDGLNHFDVGSAFAETTVPKDRDLSFNENEFINCDFRHGGKGTPIWLGDTSRHAFIRCYAATDGSQAFILHCGPNSHTLLDIDCHCETSLLEHIFQVAGSERNVRLRGFNYYDHECFASKAVFTSLGLDSVTIEGADIKVPHFRIDAALLADMSTKWWVSGQIYSDRQIAPEQNEVRRGLLELGSEVRFFS